MCIGWEMLFREKKNRRQNEDGLSKSLERERELREDVSRWKMMPIRIFYTNMSPESDTTTPTVIDLQV